MSAHSPSQAVGQEGVKRTISLYFRLALRYSLPMQIGNRFRAYPTPAQEQFPVGALAFTAHTPYTRPASLHLSVEAGKWSRSFSTEDGLPEPKEWNAETED